MIVGFNVIVVVTVKVISLVDCMLKVNDIV